MKQLLLLPATALLLASCGRDSKMQIGEFRNVDAKERTIQVTGSSETFITPDEITLTMQVHEYSRAGSMVTVKEIEKDLRKKLAALGVDEKDIQVKSVNTSWRYYWDLDRRKPVEVNKTYEVKFHSLSAIDSILPNLEVRGIETAYISGMRSTKEKELRKQVKTDALKAAKEKAEYLLAAVGKEVGDVITVTEDVHSDPSKTTTTQYYGGWPYYYYDYYNSWPYYRYGGYSSSTISSGMNSGSNSSIGSSVGNGMPPGGGGGNTTSENTPRDIKLRYEIEATFEIKQ